ncbi:MAG TPA: hypothetical protein VM074_10535 [Solimonas sp.]|nr:hypothetical protein [Solimonas sp.]
MVKVGRSIFGTALLLALAALAGCQAAPAQPPAPPPASTPGTPASFGVEQRLAVGASLRYDDGLLVTLEKVNDSRCPRDVQCIWAGELAPVLQLQDGALAAPVEVVLGTAQRAEQEAGPYRLLLVDAAPEAIRLRVTRNAAGGRPPQAR